MSLAWEVRQSVPIHSYEFFTDSLEENFNMGTSYCFLLPVLFGFNFREGGRGMEGERDRLSPPPFPALFIRRGFFSSFGQETSLLSLASNNPSVHPYVRPAQLH